MATCAVYTFTGFPESPVRHLYLHHDGYPTGAAWRLAEALREAPEPYLQGPLMRGLPSNSLRRNIRSGPWHE